MSDLTAIKERPDFFCIGVQKAGTTWLHENLKRHPRIWSPFLKEIHYFDVIYPRFGGSRRPEHENTLYRRICESAYWTTVDWNEENAARKLMRIQYGAELAVNPFSDEWYARVFAPCPPDCICGDFTPDYSLLREAEIRHVLRIAPRARFILIFRDPIERDYSHARMLTGWKETVSEESLLEAIESPDLLGRGDYRLLLEKWENLIPPAQLMTCFFDDIARRPSMLLDRIAAFLNIAERPFEWVGCDQKVLEGTWVPMPASVRSILFERHRATLAYMADRFPEPCEEWAQRYADCID